MCFALAASYSGNLPIAPKTAKIIESNGTAPLQLFRANEYRTL